VVKEITVEDFKKMRDEGVDFQLIDVREQHEYTSANMEGELIPLGTILEAQDHFAKDKPVIVHCRSGMRSANAIMTLQRFFPGEYDNLYNLKGGILAWAAAYDKGLRVE
jgi:sulfur-carrier protein adenylyltransferase/sulfurtransferase